MKRGMALLLAVVLLALCGTAMAEDTVITLSGDGIRCEGAGAVAEGGIVTITQPGTYRLSGTLTDGQVRVDCAGKGEVVLVLCGVDIHGERGPAILIDQVKPRLRLTLAEGTENRLSGGAAFDVDEEEEPNGVIFSRSDLLLDGTGSLQVDAACYDGIVSKDSLTIAGGTLTVTAARNGLRGKDSLTVSGGDLTVTCGKDGLRSTNEKDADCGVVLLLGGTVRIVCGDDPIDAARGWTLSGAALDAVITDEVMAHE